MQTSTLIQASADVVRIVSLKTGDVYKRLNDRTNYGTAVEPTLRFGVVTDVLNNGTDAAITAIEFDATYNDAKPEVKVFRTGTDVALFAAKPDEVIAHLDQVTASARRAVEEANKELGKKRAVLELAQRAFDQRAELTAAQTAPAITASA
ncbi:MAG TPA: hypothetical protein VFM55_19115 [Micromonosporaceae bacterium]|nr:hypothetical protein [Micromonosporaceae bacterium]